ncbi:uncharacterized protein LOC116267757 [Nymphaea colorata]|nr:uncharacterized protein LOC116267757 [Nymphaea colorata]
MGNCLRTHSSRSWVDDDEDDFGLIGDQTPELRPFIRGRSSADGEFQGTGGEFGFGDHKGHDQKVISTEVKIKVTKKQLEKLVSLVGMQGISAELLLETVASLGCTESETRHKHWRPALQSIPEVD